MNFISLKDQTGTINVLFKKDELSEKDFLDFKNLDIGDIILVDGTNKLNNKGEAIMKAISLEMITKAYNQLPDKHDGVKDQEMIYRQRYLDLITNNDSMDTFVKRSKIISYIRKSFENKGFLEVETPILNNIPGGANARPFITHHNALSVDRYLRIAPELYLKKLIVGGMEKVFEIGRNFRNEGIDATHNPEFTSIEFYEAYATYEEHIQLLSSLLTNLSVDITGSYLVRVGDRVINMRDVKVISFENAILEAVNIDNETLHNKDSLREFIVNELNIEVEESATKGKMWEIIFDEKIENNLINPTFITDYPIDISPLARRSDDNPEVAERFELFINGKEIANGFNELNDPIDQYERFQQQVAQKDSDDEAMHMDQDFIDALMQGMPMTAGCGIGIDRLVMLLTNNSTIKDVIAFPAMR
jgi:lysyl-tRNA synthetase class 2